MNRQRKKKYNLVNSVSNVVDSSTLTQPVSSENSGMKLKLLPKSRSKSESLRGARTDDKSDSSAALRLLSYSNTNKDDSIVVENKNESFTPFVESTTRSTPTILGRVRKSLARFRTRFSSLRSAINRRQRNVASTGIESTEEQRGNLQNTFTESLENKPSTKRVFKGKSKSAVASQSTDKTPFFRVPENEILNNETVLKPSKVKSLTPEQLINNPRKLRKKISINRVEVDQKIRLSRISSNANTRLL